MRLLLLGEERLQLALGHQAQERGRLFAKLDLFQDAVTDEADLELREAYLDYSAGSIGIRLGRQIVTWGVGDLLFINDIFPKDYAAFFSGRPLEYLKIGSDAAKVDLFTELVSAELVVIPFFQSDRFPSGERFLLFDPFPNVPHTTEEPRAEFENTELALRLYRNLMGFDAAAYAYQDRLRQLLTLRLTQLLFYQTLKLSFFAFFSPTDQDYYLIPEIRYSFTDALWGAVGANIFGGEKETTPFGQLDRNDNMYVTMRYEF